MDTLFFPHLKKVTVTFKQQASIEINAIGCKKAF